MTTLLAFATWTKTKWKWRKTNIKQIFGMSIHINFLLLVFGLMPGRQNIINNIQRYVSGIEEGFKVYEYDIKNNDLDLLIFCIKTIYFYIMC